MNKAKDIVEKVKKGEFKQGFKNLIWIFQLTDKYRKNIILYVIMLIIKLGFSIFLTVSIKDLIDLLLARDIEKLIHMVILYGGIGLLNIAISMIVQRYGSVISYKVYQENSHEIYCKIMESEWEALSEFHSGDLLNRMSNDVGVISDSVTGWIPNLLIQVLQILVPVIIITYYDPVLILVLALCAPFVFISSRIFVGKLYQYNKNQRVLDSEQVMLNKESFHNMQTIKAFGLANLFEDKVKELLERVTFVGLKVVKYSMLSWATMYLAGQVAAGICLAFSAYHVYIGLISMGTLFMIATLASYVASSFKSLISVFPQVISTVTSVDRIKKLIDIPKEQEDDEICNKIIKNGVDCKVIIKMENISFSYSNGYEVFKNMNFKASSGEIVALVGPSGEGKTTMLRILLGLVKTDGYSKIFLSGQEADGINIGPSSRRLISYVPQINMMLSGTIADNMRLVNQTASDEEIIEALENACAYEFVKKLEGGIYFEMKESGVSFSEGQNQRLAIARALLHKAPILLLDEATSALDVTTERMVIKNLAKEHNNRLCILTTHRPSVLEICDHVYKISNKKVFSITDDEINHLINEF